MVVKCVLDLGVFVVWRVLAGKNEGFRKTGLIAYVCQVKKCQTSPSGSGRYDDRHRCRRGPCHWSLK